MRIDGGCHCGAIRLEARISPKLVTICHCTDCQTMSGAPYRVNVTALQKHFHLYGETNLYVKSGSSGARVVTTFCGVCGTPIHSFKEGSDVVNIRLGVISQRSQLKPSLQGFCGSALLWAFDIAVITKV